MTPPTRQPVVPVDYRVYVITSGTGRNTVTAAAAAAGAGAGVIQVRAKDTSAVELYELTCLVADSVKAANQATRVLVDDRADIAYAAIRNGKHVHGVHLGQDDLDVRVARELLGPAAIIGLTTGTLDLVQQANQVADVIDYLGAGPYRLTPTKDSGRPALGIEGYSPLVAATALPIVAIGDITAADIRPLRTTGIAGTAVVRAVMSAPDPAAATREILDRWRD